MVILSTAEISRTLSPRVQAFFDDSHFFLLSEDYVLRDFLPFWSRHKGRVGLRYRPQVADCADFSREFVAQLVIASRNVSAKAGVAAAVLKVRNTAESLGIGKGLHALNLVGVINPTGPRWLCVEPQNNRHAYLENLDTCDSLRAYF